MSRPASVIASEGQTIQPIAGAPPHVNNNAPTAAVTSVPYGFVPPFLAGAASLVEQLDKRLLVVLRDGKHLIGVLRSFDQFTNFILEDTVERRFCIVNGNITYYYSDVKLGLYLVRGDSIVLLGEIDEETSGLDQNGCEVSLEKLESIIESKQQGGVKTQPETSWDFDLDLL
mmetsp:Transcript_4592/g.6802  ORF Transcript_4592/g.6802 Transcript_4592/m.6802 type:complete len:172 (+) Transcript_4592:47-562(+)